MGPGQARVVIRKVRFSLFPSLLIMLFLCLGLWEGDVQLYKLKLFGPKVCALLLRAWRKSMKEKWISFC